MKRRNFYKAFVSPLLFRISPEVAHNMTISGLSALAHLPNQSFFFRDLFKVNTIPTNCFGVDFPNPIGLAAGMDKKCAALPVWESMGFGFAEMGGVTQHEQPGNVGPRMFRVQSHQAIINRMGFNNPGADAIAEQLEEFIDRNLWPEHPIAFNLGKSKITDLEKAWMDYLYSFKKLRDFADFFVVNVSSPNTEGLRSLQEKDSLLKILKTLAEENKSSKKEIPILVKISPDLKKDEIMDVMSVVTDLSLAGIVATNTTTQRPTLSKRPPAATYKEKGGLSGAPLESRSNEVIEFISRHSKGKIPIIGVGGIHDFESLMNKFKAGASLAQIYTALVYEGPLFVPNLLKNLQKYMDEEGISDISQVHPSHNLTQI